MTDEMRTQAIQQAMSTPRKDPRKCPAHNMWMKKGQCEICRLEADREQAKLNRERGIVPQPIIIKKL